MTKACFQITLLVSTFYLVCPRLAQGQTPIADEHQEVFKASYDEIWRSAQLAMRGYRMRLVDYEKGLLESEVIKGSEAYTPPFSTKRHPAGLRYKLTVRLFKGRNSDNSEQNLVKTVVQKKMALLRDFFSQEKELPTDGFEEAAILYRIQREFLIEKALSRMESK